MSTSQYERTDGRDYDSCDDEKEIMEKNWKRNISEIEKVAFREGAISSETESDVMFQMGFDKGYRTGYNDGYKNGSYKSTIMLLNKFNFSENCEET